MEPDRLPVDTARALGQQGLCDGIAEQLRYDKDGSPVADLE